MSIVSGVCKLSPAYSHSITGKEEKGRVWQLAVGCDAQALVVTKVAEERTKSIDRQIKLSLSLHLLPPY